MFAGFSKAVTQPGTNNQQEFCSTYLFLAIYELGYLGHKLHMASGDALDPNHFALCLHEHGCFILLLAISVQWILHSENINI